MASIKEALDNRILGALAIAALVTMITGAINEPGYLGWIQGFSIYIAIFLIVAFTSVNDYIKDKNFVRLASEVKRDCISVTRGKRGVTQTLSIYKLVVGDIVHLEPGCMVPADCLIVSSQDLYVNETKYSDDRINQIKKVANEDNMTQFPDPFLLSNTFVNSGSALAVVCAVGARSRRGALDDKLDTESKTPLQNRLENLGGLCIKWGILASLAILGASLLNFCVTLIFDADSRSFSHILNLLSLYFTQFVAIIIVAVPEGLPLTISLSLAYSVLRMKKDGVLIKDLTSPEKMGQVDQILVGKTGTLTKGEFKIAEFYVQSKVIKNKRENTLFNTQLNPEVLRLL
jgi:magnesium-transporting ATPase (P-type)